MGCEYAYRTQRGANMLAELERGANRPTGLERDANMLTMLERGANMLTGLGRSANTHHMMVSYTTDGQRRNPWISGLPTPKSLDSGVGNPAARKIPTLPGTCI